MSSSTYPSLEVLVGKWHTVGRTRATSSAPSVQIDAFDEYERLPGGALLHRVNARVGDQKVEGAEIIGFDPTRQLFRTQYFGTDGPNAYDATLGNESGVLSWKMWSERDRFAGTFSEDRKKIVGHWELRDDAGNWQPWMDITLSQ